MSENDYISYIYIHVSLVKKSMYYINFIIIHNKIFIYLTLINEKYW